MTNEQIKYMVSRFLVWRLPENFAPDSGISFSHLSTSIRPWPMKHEPTGTNLLDATQAEEMIRYLVDGMPTDSQAEQPAPADCEWMSFSRGGLGYCRCGHLVSQQNMVPYAAYETHLQGNPHNPKTSQPEPQA